MADSQSNAQPPQGNQNLLIIAMLGVLVVLVSGSLYVLLSRQSQSPEESRVGDLAERVDSLEEKIDEMAASWKERHRGEKELRSSIRDGIEAYVAEQSGQAQAQQRQARSNSRGTGRNVDVALDETDALIGNPDAPISIIEYADYECPYCKQLHQSGAIGQVVATSDGQVNATYRHFPLSMHGETAMQAALAAECAQMEVGNDAFWTMSKAIYNRTRGGGNGVGGALPDLAAQVLDVDPEAIRSCMNSDEATRRVRADIQDGRDKGVQSTPSMLVYNHETGQVRPIRGAVGADRLLQAVNEIAP